MSNAKDIAEHGTALCVAALAFIMAPGSGLAAAAVPAATLTAIGYSIRQSNSRRACDRASFAALEQLKKHPDFVPADLARAAALLKDAQRPVDLASSDLRQAAATPDFNGTLARRLAGALAEPPDHALHNILMPVFAAAIATCRQDPDFHRDLTQELLIDAARQNGLQLQLLDQINAQTAATHCIVKSIGDKLDDIAAQSRDTLEALALRFGIAEPELLPLAELRGILIDKAKDYHRLLAQVQTLQDRDGRIAKLKAAAEDAIRALRLDEAKQLIRDAIAVQRAERTLTALRDDAGLVETEAEIVLLEGDADEAYRLLAGAADSFAPFDRLEGVERRGGYRQKLAEHGLRYGGTGLAAAIKLGQTNLGSIDEASEPYIWAKCQNDMGISCKNLGARAGGAGSAALLSKAVSAYQAALKVYTEQGYPADWAQVQNNLGNARQLQGSNTGCVTSAALLSEAVSAYHAALRVYTEEKHPVDWAMTLNNLGSALSEQSMRSGKIEGAALLSEAVSVLRAALRVYTESEHPVDWAMTLNNLGTVFQEQGARRGDAGLGRLEEAVSAYHDVLRVYTKVEHPVDWAMTQHNLGNALQLLGSRTGGTGGKARLEEAVSAYYAALSIRTAREHPTHWAMTQENLGLAQEALADNGLCTEAGGKLGQAAKRMEMALGVYDPKHMPFSFQRASASLERIRQKLSTIT